MIGQSRRRCIAIKGQISVDRNFGRCGLVVVGRFDRIIAGSRFGGRSRHVGHDRRDNSKIDCIKQVSVNACSGRPSKRNAIYAHAGFIAGVEGSAPPTLIW